MLTKEQFAAKQEHSLVGAYIPHEQVVKVCQEALRYGFAAVYVNPDEVAYVRSVVGDRLAIGTAIGFPHGAATTKSKINEGLDAIANGATDLDIVINISRMKDGDYDYVQNELTEFVRAMKANKADVIVKVIIECFYLTHAEKIKACEMVIASGADYVKQSSGTTPHSSFALGDVKLLKSVAGDKLKVKASGWILNIEDAIGAIEFGAERIGNSQAVRWLEEFDDNRWY